MKLGFVSAILSELSLEDVLTFAAGEKFDCVELMCWPTGGANRRYAGVTHVDVSKVDAAEVGRICGLCKKHSVSISGLGYYPNLLDPDVETRRVCIEHLKMVISAARLLGVGIVNTFIGRDLSSSIEATWPQVEETWPDIVRHAESCGIQLGIENCPMLFSQKDWPGGRNLATTPAVWRRLFERFPTLGLNFDPSHLIWQQIDYARAIREFGKRIVHVHAKDTRIDRDKLYEHGVTGLGWHTAKIPGLGEVDWGAFFAALTNVDYKGAVCIEVEDRAFEGSLEDRKRALRQSRRFLRQFIA